MNCTTFALSSNILIMSALMYVHVDPDAFLPCPGPCKYLLALLLYPFSAIPIDVFMWYSAYSKNLVNNSVAGSEIPSCLLLSDASDITILS